MNQEQEYINIAMGFPPIAALNQGDRPGNPFPQHHLISLIHADANLTSRRMVFCNRCQASELRLCRKGGSSGYTST